MDKNLIVTPLYYILKDTKGTELLKKSANNNTMLLLFDDIAPLPSILERHASLLNSFGLPMDSYDLHDSVFPDNDKRFVDIVLGTIKDLKADGSKVKVHYFPTDRKLIKKAKWADVIYDDFLINDLGKEWPTLKENFDDYFKARFANTWEVYLFNLKARISNSTLNVVYYGEFEIEDSNDSMPIMLGVHDYSTPEIFSPIAIDGDPVDAIVDPTLVCKTEIDRLGIEIDSVIDFKASADTNVVYGFDLVIGLKPNKHNLDILNNINSNKIDKRIDFNRDYKVLLPNSTKTYVSTWFRDIVDSAGKSEYEL